MTRYRLALVTPWIPQKTGIAVYETNILPYLDQYFEIDIYTSADFSGYECTNAFYSMPDIKKRSVQYDLVIYEMGNNASFHKDIFELLEECPANSLIELHDLVLGPFFLYSYGSASEKFASIVRRLYGEEAEEIIPLFIEHGNSVQMRINYPLGDKVAGYTKYALVHNQWCKDKIGENCFSIPLAAFRPAVSDKQTEERIYALEHKYGLGKELVIGCFGRIGNHKRIFAILAAVQGLLKEGYRFKLVFWGEVVGALTAEKIADAGMADTLIISGYLDADDYWAALQRTDIAVNLRYPSSGESSATLLEEFSVGKPVVISDYAAYREYPDDICIKIASGEDEAREQEELQLALSQLVQSKELREHLGKKAQEYVSREHDPKKVAKMYYDVVRHIVENIEGLVPNQFRC